MKIPSKMILSCCDDWEVGSIGLGKTPVSSNSILFHFPGYLLQFSQSALLARKINGPPIEIHATIKLEVARIHKIRLSSFLASQPSVYAVPLWLEISNILYFCCNGATVQRGQLH